MRLFSFRGKRQYQAPVSQISVEALENRQLLSGSITTLDSVTPPVAALTVNAFAGTKFKGEVGTWTTTTGLPKPGSGLTAIATIEWGDGKTSHGKLVDDGSGTIQINGMHTFKMPGTFTTLVNVEEKPKKHATQIVEIGQANGSAVVAPKQSSHTSLKGTLTGTYSNGISNPDARSYDFTGTGTAGAMGAVDISGSISPPGFIRTAAATGTLTLTATSTSPATSGSLTLAVMGHTQNGGSPLPEKLKYMITGGTGAFANDGGKGTISVALDSTAGTFVFVIH